MNEKLKRIATLAITTSLVGTFAMPAFAADDVTLADAEIPTAIETKAVAENSIERTMLSRYVERTVTFSHSGTGMTPPSTYYFEETYQGSVWTGTLRLQSYTSNTSFTYATYTGYLYTTV